MATKKNTVHTTPPKTRKIRPRNKAKVENLPTQASAPADMVLTQAAPMPANPAVATESAERVSEPTAEWSPIVMPTPAEETTTATAERSPEPAAPANQFSALDAAAKVLEETGQAMNCQELIAAMAAKGYWSSPHGKTPAGTLYSAILREVQTKKEQARFRKSQRGKFELRREG